MEMITERGERRMHQKIGMADIVQDGGLLLCRDKLEGGVKSVKRCSKIMVLFGLFAQQHVVMGLHVLGQFGELFWSQRRKRPAREDVGKSTRFQQPFQERYALLLVDLAIGKKRRKGIRHRERVDDLRLLQ